MKILVCDGVAKAAVDILKEKEFEIVESKALSEDELIEQLNENKYECVIIRSSTKVTQKVFEAQSSLKLVGRAGVGVDNVDLPAATAANVKVMNTPGANANAVVELTLGFMLSMVREIPRADATMKAGKWEKKAFKGRELKDKTLGLLGVGRIGFEVGRISKAFGMSVLAYDPYLDKDLLKELGEPVDNISDIIERADFISIHTPLTDETRNMLNDDAFGRMKEGVRIVNCARGGIIDEDALLKAIESGKVASAALDVFSEEPPQNKELLANDKLVLTPHIGAATAESQDNCATMLAGQIADFFLNDKAVNLVN